MGESDEDEAISLDTLRRFLDGAPTVDDQAVFMARLLVLAVDAHAKLSAPRAPEMPHASPEAMSNARTFLRRVGNGWFEPDSVSARAHVALLLPVVFPELVLPLGYDEVRFGSEPQGSGENLECLLNQGDQLHRESYATALIEWLRATTYYRSPNGSWHDSIDLAVEFANSHKGSGASHSQCESDVPAAIVSGWLARLDQPGGCVQESKFKTLTLPQLFLPPSHGDSRLHIATQSVLQKLKENKLALPDVHWRTLEEIVAELLHDMGFEVNVTDRSGDGGRDVIARGEFIPGEPMLLAVEVKHKKTVPVRDAREAMYANRHFPALLFVTSGRFSAGVFRERRENEGAMRLYLKDGQGLSQWMDQYARRNFEGTDE